MIVSRRTALVGAAATLAAARMANGPIGRDLLVLHSERSMLPPVPAGLWASARRVRLTDPSDYDELMALLDGWRGRRLVALLNHGDAAIIGAMLRPLHRVSLVDRHGMVLLEADL